MFSMPTGTPWVGAWAGRPGEFGQKLGPELGGIVASRLPLCPPTGACATSGTPSPAAGALAGRMRKGEEVVLVPEQGLEHLNHCIKSLCVARDQSRPGLSAVWGCGSTTTHPTWLRCGGL